jgi:hypothetical protein
MPMSVRAQKLLYHLTRLENLRGISANGVISRQVLRASGELFVDVADPEILWGRERLNLDAMVPFHFLCKNPFDYGVVRRYPNERFVLLTIQRTVARASGWHVLPRHPLSRGDEIEVMPWDEGMNAIAWDKIDQYPRDWENDRECKMACMAEALSPIAVPLRSMFRLYAASNDTLVEAQRFVGSSVGIEVKPNMFPGGCK